jgi:hypothetical protein
MKKSKSISLVLISAALASCDRQLYNIEHDDVYLRTDTASTYTQINTYNCFNDLWYYSFRPYGYYNGAYMNGYYGYYNAYCRHPHYWLHGRPYHYGAGWPGRSNNGRHHTGWTHYGPRTTTGGFGHRAISPGTVNS